MLQWVHGKQQHVIVYNLRPQGGQRGNCPPPPPPPPPGLVGCNLFSKNPLLSLFFSFFLLAGRDEGYYQQPVHSAWQLEVNAWCSLPCNHCSNWTWIVEEILAYGYRLRSKFFLEFQYLKLYLPAYFVRATQLLPHPDLEL